MNKVFLIEDHDEALKIWRKAGIRRATLLHFDAHLDYGFPAAESPLFAFWQARSVKELQEKLEASQLFSKYERNFSKQTDIGNFIYPAMRDGIIENFWWVIPGDKRGWERSLPALQRIIRNSFSGRSPSIRLDQGIMRVHVQGHVINICCLDTLPAMRAKNILLDIDADYCVIDSVQRANNTQRIGQRKLWIEPRTFVWRLAAKVPVWELATIAYSVNGGFTPLIFKYCADEIALYLDQGKLPAGYRRRAAASKNFLAFRASGMRRYYAKAVRLDHSYRCWDNNYGPLFLQKGDTKGAEEEFLRIYRIDPTHAGALWGLAQVAILGNHLAQAWRYAQRALRNSTTALFRKFKPDIMFTLGMIAWKKKRYEEGACWLRRCVATNRLNPVYHYWLGVFLEKQGLWGKAVTALKDAVRLGAGLSALGALQKLSCRLPEKRDIIRFVEDTLIILQKQRLDKKQRSEVQRIKKMLQRF